MLEHTTNYMDDSGRCRRRLEIGENIFLIRRRLGLTQAQLAEALGCSRHTMYRVESGEAELYITQMENLATILGVSMSDLLQLRIRHVESAIGSQE